jgi:hypothetical protein
MKGISTDRFNGQVTQKKLTILIIAQLEHEFMQSLGVLPKAKSATINSRGESKVWK